MQLSFYDEGWNAFIDGKRLPSIAERVGNHTYSFYGVQDYIEGWKDAQKCKEQSTEDLKHK